MITLRIDGKQIGVKSGTSILEAAKDADIFIPTLCYHPDLPPAKGGIVADAVFQGDIKIDNTGGPILEKGCGLCLVEVQGQADLVRACGTEAKAGMVVVTNNERIRAKRRENLAPILARHPHACLTCAQQSGCSRSQCSMNVAENERCCPQFGHCELQTVADYIGISPTTPKWHPTNLPILDKDPLIVRDYNLCIGCTRCVRACRDLRGIEAIGFVFDRNNRIQVGSTALTLAESGCKFCTACVAVCPTGALTDKHLRPGKKEEDLVPCRAACPAGIDIPGYLRLVAQDMRNEALAVIREKVPLPGVLGRICTHPCEDVCRRGAVNAPVSVCALKRFAADGDQGLWQAALRIKPDTGKKVAIVGAGPAGLTAAFYLRSCGHAVDLLDENDKPGGMLRYGIPAYRLPVAVLNQEIDDILSRGVVFKPNRKLGREVTLERLKTDYDAVFITVGAQMSRRIPMAGCEWPDVLWGLDVLRRVSTGETVTLKDRVIVIGGGNVAVDVALTALRCGAVTVSLACLEAEGDMPAGAREIDDARAQGVNILPSLGPDKIISENGKVTGLNVMTCTCVFDDKGNFCPEFNATNTDCLPVDQIIVAVGQATDLSFLEGSPVIQSQNGLIMVDEKTLETVMPSVYAGGDVTNAPGSVIHAVAAGRKAAIGIDKAFGGEGDIETRLFKRPAPDPMLGRAEGFAGWLRETMPEIEISKRKGYSEIALGYGRDQAIREASRCLQCDLRLTIGAIAPPPVPVMAFTEQQINKVPDEEGVYQLMGEDGNVLAIKGVVNLRRELLYELEDNERAAFFEFETDKMYSKRESELIQMYLQAHGEMPGDDDDDLF